MKDLHKLQQVHKSVQIKAAFSAGALTKGRAIHRMNRWKPWNLSSRWEENHIFLLKMSFSQSLLPLRFSVPLVSACQTKHGTLFTEWDARNISRSTVIIIVFTHRFRDDSVHLRMPLLETKRSVLLVPEMGLKSGLLNRHSSRCWGYLTLPEEKRGLYMYNGSVDKVIKS